MLLAQVSPSPARSREPAPLRQYGFQLARVGDSGLLAHLVGADEQRIVEDGGVAGAMLVLSAT